MPQGPTSRGCEACRAQKKKCDIGQPSCSRCQRLRISCVGAGRQRFKFVTTSTQEVVAQAIALQPSPALENETTCLRQALVTRLQNSGDIRYSIVFRYGRFLFEIPRYLGRNKALDAAVLALLKRHAETSRREDQSDGRAPAVVAYHHALAALRVDLVENSDVLTPEILCAVILLVYCQARFDDQFTFFWSPHGQGVAHLTRARNFAPSSDPLESGMFGTLCATVLLQSMGNPEVSLEAQEYRKLEGAFLDTPLTTHDLRYWGLMVEISELMSQARIGTASSPRLAVLAVKAVELHEVALTVIAATHDRLRMLESQCFNQNLDMRLHASYQRAYGMALATMAKLLCIQRTISPQDSTLSDFAASLCHNVLLLSEDARAYRPLGAVWTVHMLICSWCATPDPDLKRQLEESLLDYQKDAMGPQAELQMDSLRLLQRRLTGLA